MEHVTDAAAYKKADRRFRLCSIGLSVAIVIGPGRYILPLTNDVSAPMPTGSPLVYTIVTGLLILLVLPFYFREMMRLDRMQRRLQEKDAPTQ